MNQTLAEPIHTYLATDLSDSELSTIADSRGEMIEHLDKHLGEMRQLAREVRAARAAGDEPCAEIDPLFDELLTTLELHQQLIVEQIAELKMKRPLTSPDFFMEDYLFDDE